MIRGKKGLSPVVATVLLIGIVIAIALIVFLGIRGMIEEDITKFDNENVKISCERVDFAASFSNSNIFISNNGNVPVYQMKGKFSGAGSYDTHPIVDGWEAAGLLTGDSIKSNLDKIPGGTSYDKVVLIPVLAGSSDEGTKTYTCDDKFGQEVTL